MKTKLQIALDDISLEDALALVKQIKKYVDIVEAGTPFIMRYGTEAVHRMKQEFPDLEILFDGKIMDAGRYEADLAYEAGADYVTVLGVTDDRTILDVVMAARRAGKQVMADMIAVTDFQKRISRLEKLGVDIIAVHTGVDQQAYGRTPLDDLSEMRQYVKAAQIAVAGGIRADTIDSYLEYNPEIIIVGGGIIHTKDPVTAAKELAERIWEWEG